MSEPDVILNRANVALARSQRLVSSWLTPKDEDKHGDGQSLPQPKSEEDLQREESDLFTPVPETLGLGAPLPSKLPDGSWNRTELDSNDALRKQLLGRNYQRVMKEKEKEKQLLQQPGTGSGSGSGSGSGTGTGTGTGNGESNGKGTGEDDTDEEDGRTAVVGKGHSQAQKKGPSRNQKKRKAAREQAQDIQDKESEPEPEPEPQARTKPTKPARAKSFLDEILADRSKKRKKR